MNSNKIWLLLGGVVSVIVLIMGWFLGVSPKLDEMNTSTEQKASVDAQNAAFQQNINELQKESKSIDKVKEQLKELQVALPPGGELPAFLGQLHELEAASGVKLEAFSTTDGQQFVAVPNGTDTKVSPLVTRTNFIVIPITLKVSGDRAPILNFVHALQFGKRLFLVNSLTIQSGSSTDQGYTGTIDGFVYVLVDPSAPLPVVTPIAPISPTPTPTPTPGK